MNIVTISESDNKHGSFNPLTKWDVIESRLLTSLYRAVIKTGETLIISANETLITGLQSAGPAITRYDREDWERRAGCLVWSSSWERLSLTRDISPSDQTSLRSLRCDKHCDRTGWHGCELLNLLIRMLIDTPDIWYCAGQVIMSGWW